MFNKCNYSTLIIIKKPSTFNQIDIACKEKKKRPEFLVTYHSKTRATIDMTHVVLRSGDRGAMFTSAKT